MVNAVRRFRNDEGSCLREKLLELRDDPVRWQRAVFGSPDEGGLPLVPARPGEMVKGEILRPARGREIGPYGAPVLQRPCELVDETQIDLALVVVGWRKALTYAYRICKCREKYLSDHRRPHQSEKYLCHAVHAVAVKPRRVGKHECAYFFGSEMGVVDTAGSTHRMSNQNNLVKFFQMQECFNLCGKELEAVADIGFLRPAEPDEVHGVDLVSSGEIRNILVPVFDHRPVSVKEKQGRFAGKIGGSGFLVAYSCLMLGG